MDEVQQFLVQHERGEILMERRGRGGGGKGEREEEEDINVS
jgi:hypothetical protein